MVRSLPCPDKTSLLSSGQRGRSSLPEAGAGLTVRLLRALEEALDYSPPSDPEKLLYDFYVLSYCSTLPSDPTKPDQMGRAGGSFFARSHIKDDIDYAFSSLLTPLREELLNAVFFSVCAEIRHIMDNPQPDALVKELTGDAKKVIKEYIRRMAVQKSYAKNFFQRRKKGVSAVGLSLDDWKAQQDQQTQAAGDYGTRKDVGSSSGYDDSYRNVLKAIKTAGVTKTAFVNAAGICFRKGKWNSAFGGEAWAKICDGWMHLASARGTQEMATYIDHVYDLQHNTDTVFNKVKKYSQGGSFSWIKKALDQKASVSNIKPLLLKCSSQARRIGHAAMKMAGQVAPPEDPTGEKGGYPPTSTATGSSGVPTVGEVIDAALKLNAGWKVHALSPAAGKPPVGIALVQHFSHAKGAPVPVYWTSDYTPTGSEVVGDETPNLNAIGMIRSKPAYGAAVKTFLKPDAAGSSAKPKFKVGDMVSPVDKLVTTTGYIKVPPGKYKVTQLSGGAEAFVAIETPDGPGWVAANKLKKAGVLDTEIQVGDTVECAAHGAVSIHGEKVPSGKYVVVRAGTDDDDDLPHSTKYLVIKVEDDEMTVLADDFNKVSAGAGATAFEVAETATSQGWVLHTLMNGYQQVGWCLVKDGDMVPLAYLKGYAPDGKEPSDEADVAGGLESPNWANTAASQLPATPESLKKFGASIQVPAKVPEIGSEWPQVGDIATVAKKQGYTIHVTTSNGVVAGLGALKGNGKEFIPIGWYQGYSDADAEHAGWEVDALTHVPTAIHDAPASPMGVDAFWKEAKKATKAGPTPKRKMVLLGDLLPTAKLLGIQVLKGTTPKGWDVMVFAYGNLRYVAATEIDGEFVSIDDVTIESNAGYALNNTWFEKTATKNAISMVAHLAKNPKASSSLKDVFDAAVKRGYTVYVSSMQNPYRPVGLVAFKPAQIGSTGPGKTPVTLCGTDELILAGGSGSMLTSTVKSFDMVPAALSGLQPLMPAIHRFVTAARGGKTDAPRASKLTIGEVVDTLRQWGWKFNYLMKTFDIDQVFGIIGHAPGEKLHTNIGFRPGYHTTGSEIQHSANAIPAEVRAWPALPSAAALLRKVTKTPKPDMRYILVKGDHLALRSSRGDLIITRDLIPGGFSDKIVRWVDQKGEASGVGSMLRLHQLDAPTRLAVLQYFGLLK